MSQAIEDSRGGAVSRFAQGVGLLAEGFSFLRSERRLWPLALVPVFFAMVGIAGAATLFWSYLDPIHTNWVELFPIFEASGWWTWIWIGPATAFFWLLGWIAVVLSFAVSLLMGLLLANLASAPFLDQLSQRVEAIVLGDRVPASGASSSVFAEILRSFAAELQRLGFLGGVWLSLSLIGFLIPGAHLVTGPILVATTILFLPLDYAGFALDRRSVSFASRRRWLWSELPTMVGFGGVAFGACMIPGLNLLILPSLVTAGTLLVLRARPLGDEREAADSPG